MSSSRDRLRDSVMRFAIDPFKIRLWFKQLLEDATADEEFSLRLNGFGSFRPSRQGRTLRVGKDGVLRSSPPRTVIRLRPPSRKHDWETDLTGSRLLLRAFSHAQFGAELVAHPWVIISAAPSAPGRVICTGGDLLAEPMREVASGHYQFALTRQTPDNLGNAIRPGFSRYICDVVFPGGSQVVFTIQRQATDASGPFLVPDDSMRSVQLTSNGITPPRDPHPYVRTGVDVTPIAARWICRSNVAGGPENL